MKKIYQRTFEILSKSLGAPMRVDVFHPVDLDLNQFYPLVLLNDGQDMEAIELGRTLFELWRDGHCVPFVVAAVHAYKRMDTYGVAGLPDYKGRGGLAWKYSRFIVDECLPFLKKQIRVHGFSEHIIGGFSLGGLSAFDIAWHHPQHFSTVMAASPSFWWRSKDLMMSYTDADRIIHQVVQKAPAKPRLRIWIQVGTLDETADRNLNGIIDSLDDARDLVKELINHGFKLGSDLHYFELHGGRHTMETYGIVLPIFIKWALAPINVSSNQALTKGPFLIK